MIKQALISVSDKTGIVEFAQGLVKHGVELLSTGGTYRLLQENDVPVTEVSEHTGFPEIMGGRVKTLHPKIHSGILADQNNPEHLAKIAELDIAPFDLVIINLYPFAATIESGADYAECIEQIDIGGPSMLRGAAKNHGSVAVISSPSQYDGLLNALKNGGYTLAERKKLAIEVFRTTAEYDATIAMWMGDNDGFHDWMAHIWKKSSELRYGENPHQIAAVYSSNTPGIVSAKQLHGKEMSFNNYTDAEAALRAAFDHSQPAVAIIKHANPCGIAIGKDIASAYLAAHACDPVSAFGGVVAANRTITAEMAEPLSEVFTEVVVAPDYEPAALEILKRKPNIRILATELKSFGPVDAKFLSGGLILQTTDLIDADGDNPKNWKQVSGAVVSAAELSDLEFAWRAVRCVQADGAELATQGWRAESSQGCSTQDHYRCRRGPWRD